MSSRPAQVRYVTEGLSLGAAVHKGWAATWNWVLSWVLHFAGGRGCAVKHAAGGHPRLDVLIEAGDGIEVTGGGPGEPYVISASGKDGKDGQDGTGGGGGGGGGGDGDDDKPDFAEGLDGERRVVVAMRYDAQAHAFQAKYATVTYGKGIVTAWDVDSEWTDVFEAEAHRPEVS